MINWSGIGIYGEEYWNLSNRGDPPKFAWRPFDLPHSDDWCYSVYSISSYLKDATQMSNNLGGDAANFFFNLNSDEKKK